MGFQNIIRLLKYDEQNLKYRHLELIDLLYTYVIRNVQSEEWCHRGSSFHPVGPSCRTKSAQQQKIEFNI